MELRQTNQIAQKLNENQNMGAFINCKNGSYSEFYKLGGLLGSSNICQIRQVTHRRNKQVRAMKVIDKQKANEQQHLLIKLWNEIQIIQKLDHPNILKIYEMFQDNLFYYLIIDLTTGGELFDKIIEKGTLTEKEASNIMKQLISTIYYAHSSHIVHRNLNAENILLDFTDDGQEYIKVIGWERATMLVEGVNLTEKIDTSLYMAPEVISGQYDEKCDIWSCGVILFILLFGKPPFQGKTEKEIHQNILTKDIKWILTLNQKNISKEAQELVIEMLNKNPKQRPSAKDILQQKWFDKMQIDQEDKCNSGILLKGIDNLRSFRAVQKLQKAAISFIAGNIVSKEEKQQLMQAFKELDTNGDGTLSRNEIAEGLKRVLNNDEQLEDELNRVMNIVDTNHSGAIDYSEFIAAALDRKKVLAKESIKAAFNLFDKDGNGKLTAYEIKQVLSNKLEELNNDKQWQDIINEVDKNGDGVISLDEFTELMMSYYG